LRRIARSAWAIPTSGRPRKHLVERLGVQELGIVRAERERTVEIPGGPLEVLAEEADLAEDLVEEGVAVVETERAVRVVVGEPPVLLEAAPELAAPFVEPGAGETGMGAGAAGVDLERPLEERARRGVGLGRALAQQGAALQDEEVGCGVARAAPGRGQERLVEAGVQGADDPADDLVLHGEDLARRHLDPVAPDLGCRRGLAQRGGEAQAVAQEAELGAQDVADADPAGDLGAGATDEQAQRRRATAPGSSGTGSARCRGFRTSLPPRAARRVAENAEGQHGQERLAVGRIRPAIHPPASVSRGRRSLRLPRVRRKRLTM
jgi:hypothetical protein